MSELKVRKMTLDDIDDVLEIENKSFLTPWTSQSFEREIRENMLAVYLVVEMENNILGYGGMWMIIDEAHITNIAVHPNFRNRDIGSYLLKSMIEYAEKLGIYRMTLEVRKSNIPAQRLYKKFGFESCGIRPKYYMDTNEDAIIMWKG